MMKISNLYTIDEHKRNIGHFADIVKLAKFDGGEISEKEAALINRLSIILNLSPEEKESVLADPSKYKTYSAIGVELRIKYLYNLTRMLLVDGQLSEQGLITLKRISAGLGFSSDKVDDIVEEAVDMFLRIPDLDDFEEKIRKVL